ncbi:MAG: type 4a pilus biogenesis protein PilO [Patescibacteria group bacterium]|nr:type 4a pilus biogenesis protein PilO [Patescibacteria group bacterium]
MNANIVIKKNIQRYRDYFLPFAVLLLIIVLTMSFLQPKISDIIFVQKDLNNASQRLSKLTGKAAGLSSLDVNLLKTKYKILEGALPSQKDIPGFLIEMQRIANEASISVDKVELSAGSLSTPSASAVNTNVANRAAGSEILPDAISAKVTITGTFDSIRQFLDKISMARRLVNIRGINLGGGQSQKASGPISLELIFSLYYKPLPKTLGEISDPLPEGTPQDDKVYQQISAYPLYSSFEGAGSVSVPVGKTDLFH